MSPNATELLNLSGDGDSPLPPFLPSQLPQPFHVPAQFRLEHPKTCVSIVPSRGGRFQFLKLRVPRTAPLLGSVLIPPSTPTPQLPQFNPLLSVPPRGLDHRLCVLSPAGTLSVSCLKTSSCHQTEPFGGQCIFLTSAKSCCPLRQAKPSTCACPAERVWWEFQPPAV